MRIFHRLGFEGIISGINSIRYSDPDLVDLMGAVDMIHISGYATQVSGTSPNFNVYVEESLDRIYWIQTAYVIQTLSLSTSQETLFQAKSSDPNQYATLPFRRLNISLGGTNPQGYFRVWVTGRDWSRRAKSIMQQVTDTVDLAPSPTM